MHAPVNGQRGFGFYLRYDVSMNRFIAAIVLAATTVAAHADDYADARAALIAAYQAEDYPAMVDAARRAIDVRPTHPGARFNLAFAHALNGEPEFALDTLSTLMAYGVEFGVEDMEAFAAVRELPGWPVFQRHIAQMRAPQGGATTAQALADGHFVPEGIAVDESGATYLGSIRKGVLLRGGEVLSDRQGHWSVFGMRFHDDGSLWFASAAVPQLEDVGDDLGKTGLFRLDPESREITRAAVLPQHAEQQVLGDLIIDGDTIYTTDSLTGGVYRYDIEADEYAALLEPGVLRSPQGLVLDGTGRFLLVADYTDGLYRLDLADGTVKRLRLPGELAIDYGIDGLYRHGERLIAIQNGLRPHRVLSIELDERATEIRGVRILATGLPEFDEPTLGAIHGDALYFVANSHWNRFDRENRLPDGLSGPIVLKLDLGHSTVLDR